MVTPRRRARLGHAPLRQNATHDSDFVCSMVVARAGGARWRRGPFSQRARPHVWHTYVQQMEAQDEAQAYVKAYQQVAIDEELGDVRSAFSMRAVWLRVGRHARGCANQKSSQPEGQPAS